MTQAAPDRAAIRRDLVWLALGSTILFLAGLGARDLWNPNEPAYGLAVREMAQRGDWLLPTVNGQVFAEKPALYYWLALVVSKVAGGVSEWTLRAPSAAAAVAGTLLVYLLALPYTARGRALLAAALFATQYLVWWSSHWVQMDLLVAVTTLASVFFAARAVDHGMRAAIAWPLAGAAAGLGFAAKGPVGIVCPALALVPYLVATRRLGVIRSRWPWIALGVAAVAASPWYLALALKGQHEALREVLFRQNVLRVLEPWDHERPWWYFLKHVWIDFAPWSWFLPLAAAIPGRADDEKRLDRLAWGWLAATLLFFSLSPSKRSPYVLPVAPAVALLSSGLLSAFLAQRLSRWRRTAVRVLLAAGGIAAVAAGPILLSYARREHPEYAGLAQGAALLGIAGGLFILGGAALRKPAAALTAWLALLVSTYLFAAVVVLPGLDARKSARTFCEQVNTLVPKSQALVSYGLWELRASYAYYAKRTIPNLTSASDLQERWESPEPLFVLLEEWKLAELRPWIDPSEPKVSAVIGNTTVHLYANPAASVPH